jgi:hypothetical protein
MSDRPDPPGVDWDDPVYDGTMYKAWHELSESIRLLGRALMDASPIPWIIRWLT